MMIRSIFSALQIYTSILLLAAIAGCANSPRLVTQGFSCEMWNDGWGDKVSLLEYSYGDAMPAVRQKSNDGAGLGCVGLVWAPMPTASFLYVKWRIKSTNEIVEKRIDLRGRLPFDMKGQEVTFLIDGQELYVYVVTPIKITKNLPKAPLRAWKSRYQVTYEIYPANNLRTQEPK